MDLLIENTEVFEIKAQDKSREMVKLNRVTLLMQVDTGSDVTLIPRNFWERMGRPKLKKSNLQFKKFDALKTHLRQKNRFEIIPIIVVENIKSHGLL